MGDEPDVLLVGTAPELGEAAWGGPAGRAQLLLGRLLGAAGLEPGAVATTSLAGCLPPDGRDPAPREVADCVEHLAARVAALRPVVVVALGAFTTKLLRDDPAPIRERRGRDEARALGGHPFWLLPTFDPAAALYAPASVEQLRADLGRLGALVARGCPEIDVPAVAPVAGGPDAVAVVPGQLELF